MLMKLLLPVLIHERNKLFFMTSLYAASVFLYLVAGRFFLTTPTMLPFTFIDAATPFWPTSIWLYVSAYLFLIVAYFNITKLENLNKYFYSLMAMQLFAFLIFLVWPTSFPRDTFPLPEEMDVWSRYLFDIIRTTDAPTNCFPSLHVAWVFLATLTLYDESRTKFRIFLPWACLIAISTITTKQHYVVDGFAGIIVAGGFFWIFHRFFSYKNSETIP